MSLYDQVVRVPPTIVTEASGQAAYEEWGANCGPGALAGLLGLTLDDVRPHMGDFEEKGYTNPTLMYAALKSLAVPFEKLRDKRWPDFGLVRVQWEGPWTEPQVPMRARYRYTHWIGTALVAGSRRIYDINCVNNGSGWTYSADWIRIVVPHLTSLYPKASGEWSIANSLEVEVPSYARSEGA